MRRCSPPDWVACSLAGALVLSSAGVSADGLGPPWSESGQLGVPEWAHSVTPKAQEPGTQGDMVLFVQPDRQSARRGVTAPGLSLPLFGQRRGSGCSGVWWLVGPVAWTCSDGAALSADDPSPGDSWASSIPQYFFVTHSDANAYGSVAAIEQGSPDRQLESGWGVAVVGHEAIAGERWARTSKRLWIAETDVAAARPTTFHGQLLDGNLPDIAWVISDNASTWPTAADPPKGKRPVPLAHKARFEVVSVLEEQGSMLRVDDGAWMRKSDVARPALSSPPVEVTGEHERWIDVDRASQTLVAYEGHRPVLATLTSTGRELDDKTRTPAGVHRVWMKLLASDMGHAERDDAEANYALEDVPYVQFFDNGIGLHGTYWHSDFGHPRSHGCVNLSLADAKWLFSFTNPRLPAAWTAAAPTIADAGTVVRVR